MSFDFFFFCQNVVVNLRHKSDKTRIFVISDDTKGLFLFLLFFGSVVIWREIFVVFFWICWWEEIEFIWPTWIRHLILWVLFMPQNAGGDPIKGKFVIVLVVIKKKNKELKNPAWIYHTIDHSKNQPNRTFGYYCAAEIWIHMIMNSSTIPLSTDYATKRRKTSNKRQVCYCFYWKKGIKNSCWIYRFKNHWIDI